MELADHRIDPEVEDLDPVIGSEHHIVRGQVPVGDFTLMCIVDGGQNLLCKRAKMFLIAEALMVARKELPQSPAVYVLADEKRLTRRPQIAELVG